MENAKKEVTEVGITEKLLLPDLDELDKEETMATFVESEDSISAPGLEKSEQSEKLGDDEEKLTISEKNVLEADNNAETVKEIEKCIEISAEKTKENLSKDIKCTEVLKKTELPKETEKNEEVLLEVKKHIEILLEVEMSEIPGEDVEDVTEVAKDSEMLVDSKDVETDIKIIEDVNVPKEIGENSNDTMEVDEEKEVPETVLNNTEVPSDVNKSEVSSDIINKVEVSMKMNIAEVDADVNKVEVLANVNEAKAPINVNEAEILSDVNKAEISAVMNKADTPADVNMVEVPANVNKANVNETEIFININKTDIPVDVNNSSISVDVTMEDIPADVNNAETVADVIKAEVLTNVKSAEISANVNNTEVSTNAIDIKVSTNGNNTGGFTNVNSAEVSDDMNNAEAPKSVMNNPEIPAEVNKTEVSVCVTNNAKVLEDSMNCEEVPGSSNDNLYLPKMEIVEEKPIAKLIINGYEGDDKDYKVMTMKELRDIVKEKVEKLLKDPDENPLLQAQRRIDSLVEEIEAKKIEATKLIKSFESLSKGHVKFLRHMGALPKIETKSVAVGVDLDCLPDIENGITQTNANQNQIGVTDKRQHQIIRPKKHKFPVECIDLTDDEAPKPSKTKPERINVSNSSILYVSGLEGLAHPAPLPVSTSFCILNSCDIPPKPKLEVAIDKNGILLQWDMPSQVKEMKVTGYEIFGYQEQSHMKISSSLWKKIGTVNPLPLPMSCTLTQFVEGCKYHFSIRAITNDTIGHFSVPCTLMFKAKN